MISGGELIGILLAQSAHRWAFDDAAVGAMQRAARVDPLEMLAARDEEQLLRLSRAGIEAARFIEGHERVVRSVHEQARAGSVEARDVLGIVGRHLGVGIANYVNIFNPELVVIGGGISAAGEILLEHARAMLAAADRVERDMADYGTGIKGQVRLLATVSCMAESLPGVWAAVGHPRKERCPSAWGPVLRRSKPAADR